MKSCVLTVILLAAVNTCLGSGWHDFVLDIGDGYNITRCNSMDISLGNKNGYLVSRYIQSDIGPVVDYINGPKYIFVKTLGRKNRGKFPGDTYEEIDSSKEYYFILDKSNDAVAGPFDLTTFSARPEITAAGPLNWKEPKNPDVWNPLMGDIFFILFTLIFLSIKYFWISIPLLVLIILLIRHTIRKVRQKRLRTAACRQNNSSRAWTSKAWLSDCSEESEIK